MQEQHRETKPSRHGLLQSISPLPDLLWCILDSGIPCMGKGLLNGLSQNLLCLVKTFPHLGFTSFQFSDLLRCFGSIGIPNCPSLLLCCEETLTESNLWQGEGFISSYRFQGAVEGRQSRDLRRELDTEPTGEHCLVACIQGHGQLSSLAHLPRVGPLLHQL